MKKKHKICFALAILFTLSSLMLAATSVDGLLYVIEMRNAEGEKAGIAGLIGTFGLTVTVVLLFFSSFCGVVTSEVGRHTCPVPKMRLTSRIMLGINGTLMAASFALFLWSLIV